MSPCRGTCIGVYADSMERAGAVLPWIQETTLGEISMHSYNTQARTHLKRIIRVALFVLALPLVLGAACPAPLGGGTILNNNDPLTQTGAQLPALPQPVIAAICGSGPDAFKLLQFNGTTNRLTTISVVGGTTSSRPQVIVFDNNSGNIVAQNATQTTQTVTLTFTPNSSQGFAMLITDCGNIAQATAQATAYNTTVN